MSHHNKQLGEDHPFLTLQVTPRQKTYTSNGKQFHKKRSRRKMPWLFILRVTVKFLKMVTLPTRTDNMASCLTSITLTEGKFSDNKFFLSSF
jgi:hypothetical protein